MQNAPFAQHSPHCSSCVSNIEQLQKFCDENNVELIFAPLPVGVLLVAVPGRTLLFVNFEIRPHRSLMLAFETVGISLALMSNVAA